MTVSNADFRAGPYEGNGAATTFAFGFKIFKDADIEVVHTDSNGVDTVLTLDVDYSVTGAGDDAGGSITYPITGTPLPAGEKLTLILNLETTQGVDLQNRGGFYPQVIEDALDKVTLLIKQLEEATDRALKLPTSADTTIDKILKGFAASRYLAVDGAGAGLVFVDAEPGETTALRQDLKGGLAAVSPWSAGVFSAAFADTGTFTIAGGPTDDAGIDLFHAGRRVRVLFKTSAVYVYATIASASYNAGTEITTVNLTAITTGNGTTATLADEPLTVWVGAISAINPAAAARRYTEKLTPLMFGAVGDGVADDTDAIRAMFAVSGSVEFPDGYTFGHVGGFTLPARFHITGKGRLLKLSGDGVTLLAQNTTAANVIAEIEITNKADGLTENYSNDAIRLETCSNVSIYGVYINGAAGGGITLLNSSDCRIERSYIYDVGDNSIFGANVGCDRNIVYGNICDTTKDQNCIFFTASADSTATTDYIYDNVIASNVCRNAGDTPIETGIHTVRTIISGNNIEQSVNPGVLARDCLHAMIAGNSIRKLSTAVATPAISVVAQTETESFETFTRILYNDVSGFSDGIIGFIQIQQSAVSVRSNYIHQDQITPYNGPAVGVYGGVADVEVKDNVFIGFQKDVDLVSWTGERLSVADNTIRYTGLTKASVYSAINNEKIQYSGSTEFAVDAPETQFETVVFLAWTADSNARDVAEVSLILVGDPTTYARMTLQSNGAVVDQQSNNIATDVSKTYRVAHDAPSGGFLIQREAADTTGLGQFMVKLRFL